MYKIKQSDLIGDIKGFPIEVVQKMVERQVEQGNKSDVTVFQRRSDAAQWCGGFDFSKTAEGHSFWGNIMENNFNVFFERYPNKNVYYRGIEGRGDEIIKALEILGARNAGCFGGNYGKCLYFIKENGYMDSCADDSLVANILQRGFTELFLPEIETIEIDGKKFRKDEVIEIIKEKGLKEIK